MPRLSRFLLGLALAVEIMPGHAAQPPVYEVDSIDNVGSSSVTALHGLTNTLLGSATVLHLASYHCAGGPPCASDGGEGLLVLQPGVQCHFGSTGPGTPEDGGSFFADASNNCWYRKNLNGDLRQWGITVSSSYDVNYNLQHGTPSSIENATPTITKAILALGAVGITSLHTHQVSIKIGLDDQDNPLAIPAGGSLTCDSAPVKNAHNANYTNLPGSLIIVHTSGSTNFIDANTNNDTEVYGCAAVIPEWYINPSDDVLNSFGGKHFNTANSSNFRYPDLEAIRANMILAGDFAIKAGAGAKIHDIGTYGFDNCLYVTNGPGFLGKNVAMDCPIGAYLANNRGAMTVKDLDNNPRLTKQPGFDNEEAWDIWKIEPSSNLNLAGRPLCRVTLRRASGGHDFTDLQQSATVGRGDPAYYPVWISTSEAAGKSCTSPSTGRFGNDAAWAIGSITSTELTREFDLVGSDYASPSNGIATSATWLANTGILRVAGPISNLVTGMQVTSGDSNWPQCGTIACTLIVTGIVTRATGPDPNDGYNGYVIVSPPPSLANSGGDTPASVTFSNTSVTYVDNTPCIVDANNTASGNCAYVNAAERYVAGNSPAGYASARLPASRGGHLGAGVLVDNIAGLRAINVDTYGHYYNIAAIDSEQCDFDQIKGDDNGELNIGNTVGIYSTGDSRGCVFDSEGAGKPGASLVLDTFGTVDRASIGSTMDVNMLGSDPNTVGIVLSGIDTTALPPRGEAHLCSPANCADKSEIVVYTIASIGTTGSITVNVRARFGTAPQDWSGVASANVYPTTVNNGSSDHPGKSATTTFANLNTPTTTVIGNAFEVHHGAANFSGLHTSAGGIGFISTNTSGVAIAATNDPNTTIVFEDGNARIQTTVTPDSQFANFAAPGATNLPMAVFNPGGAVQTVNLSGLGASDIGPITVSDNANWPQNGVLAADGGEMGFTLPADGSSAQLVVTSRGECGTIPATHGSSVQIRFLVTELPCGSAGLKGYADNGFTLGAPAGGDQGTGTFSTAKQIYENNGHPVPGIVCASGTAQAAGTTEAILASCKIPGGVMGANGCVAVDALWDWSTSANTKTIKVYANATNTTIAGGTTYLSSSTNLGTAQRTVVKICNRNSATSQIGGALSGTTSVSTSGLPTSSIDTASDWYVLFTGVRASGDTLALEQYQALEQPSLP